MDQYEVGSAVLTLRLDEAESQMRSLEQRLGSALAAVGEGTAARFRRELEPCVAGTRDWETAAAGVKSRFDDLCASMGGAVEAALAPAAESVYGFMDAAAEAAASFRTFVLTLMGKDTENGVKGTAAVVAAAGKSASGAGRSFSGAAREARRSLMAFDQINRLDMDRSGSGYRGSGRGGSGALRGLAEDLKAWSGRSLFGEALRGLLRNRMYFEAGKLLAKRFGTIVDELDRYVTGSALRKRIGDALDAFTGTVNGFLTGMTLDERGRRSAAERLGDLIGDTVGLGLESAHRVLSGLRWPELGRSIAQSLNGAVRSLRENPVKLGTVIADWLNAGTGHLSGLFGELDWDGMGALLGENITAWFTGMDWTRAGEAIRRGVLGLKEAAAAAIRETDISGGDILNALEQLLLGEGAEAWNREHPFWAGLLGLDQGLRLRVTDVEDKVPGRKRLLGGFTAGVAAWAEAMAGVYREKWLDFGAVLSSWRDGLRSKAVDFQARLSSWRDALSGKIVDFQSRLTTWKDALSDKAVSFRATLTSWRDALSDKVVSFQAKLTTWRDALSGKAVSFQAKLTTWKDALAAKLLSFGAKLTEWRDALSGKVVSFQAKLTSWTDALRNKTISFTATISSFVGNLGSKLKAALGLRAEGGVYAGGHWAPIQRYAGGGAPGGGQLFVAREAGPELVGTLGGHTAVMNNDQIVASVSAGVARAVAGVRFYSRDSATPHLAAIGESVSRSEQHLSRMAQRTEERSGGDSVIPELLRQIVRLLETMDSDVYLDGVSVKDRVVHLINAETRATGRCGIIV